MTDDEREVEATRERAADAAPADDGTGESPEETVDSFLELEAELGATDGATDLRGDAHPSGQVVGAETVPADAVPDSYPVEVSTERALALRLVLRNGTRTTVYLEWPGAEGVDPDSGLGRLLAALDISAASFADLYGERLLLTRDGSNYTVLVPPAAPDDSSHWELGVVGGLAFNLLVLGLLGLAAAGVSVGGLLRALAVPFVVVNLLVLPWATYKDARYLRTHSDWRQGPPFWAALSVLPVVNVGVSALYLWSRSRARFIGDEPSVTTKLVETIRSLL